MAIGNVMRFVGLACLPLTLCTFSAAAKDNIERSGDLLETALPLISLTSTLMLEDDFQGTMQFAKSFVLSELTTLALKKTVHARRPNGECCTSFPSGHTSASFMAASFIHYRYGWQYAVPAYAAATYVAYSRVHAKKHYTRDVIAGAAVGILSSRYFTKEYHGFTLTPYADGHQFGIQVNAEF